MQLNAVRTLRCQRNGHRHQLLVQDIDCALFERFFIEGPKGLHCFRCVCIELLQPSEVLHIKHVANSISVLCKASPRIRGTGSAFGYTSQGFKSESPKRTGIAKFDPPNPRTIATL